MAHVEKHQRMTPDRTRVDRVWWECSDCGNPNVMPRDNYCSRCGVRLDRKG